MSATAPRQVTFKDLAEEAKKRIVFLAICVVGLSYLMSLTSSSVWVNLPAAATLIILLRYFSLDFDVRKKAATYNSKRPATDSTPQKKHVEALKVIKKSDWRKKVDSQAVEDAMDHFTRHIVSEWVTDLWYSRITPDKDGPEELVQIINDVLAGISARAKNVNLIDLLTRDLVTLICTHLEIFRLTQAKIEKQQLESITIENRDTALRHIMASENKLHPALFSVEAEHKVLQHLVDGLMSFIFKPEDLQCCFFRYVARELLACAVLRPILNLANPRFINERIEGVYISKINAEKAALVAQEVMQSKSGPPRVSADHFSRFLDPTGTGVELVQLKTKKSNSDDPEGDSKDPLLSIDTRSSRSLGSMSANSQNGNDKNIQRHRSGGEWGEMLDLISRRKAQALAPEHFENMWTKGRNYKRKEGENRLIEQVPQNFSTGRPVSSANPKAIAKPIAKGNTVKRHPSGGNIHVLESGDTASVNYATRAEKSIPDHSGIHDDDEHSHMRLQETDSGSTSYTSDDEGTDTVTGLGSPGTKVWDGKSKRSADSHIHHPLETFEGKTNRGQLRYQRFPNGQSGRKRSRVSSRNVPVWHEVERTSFLSGDGQDILSVSKGYGNGETSSDDTDDGILDRATSGTAASSSAISASLPEYHTTAVKSLQNELVLDNFLKLRCEVIGANIVRSGSKTFAVYSLSVTDANNNSWSVKRRFRHFEELHRRLKAFPEYNLHLPPKHFLSTGLDVPVIQERCRLLDGYLKKLMQLHGISGSIEVWDFLSVDSQTYYFSNSFSIVETLSVNMDNKPSAKSKTMPAGPTVYPFARKECSVPESKGTAMQTKHSTASDGSRLNGKGEGVDSKGNGVKEETSEILNDADNDPTLPSEWVPPNLSVPLLDLVDVIFQLQDGGWIRRKAFWVAKQVLQLGMSDAFDDWLIEKIQLLRRGSVVASGIKRVEQILWPDGIFITKHPKRQKPPPPGSSPRTPKSPQSSEIASPTMSDEQQQLEADRRAKLVYEIMIDRAPAAIVSLVGRREYEQCAKDLYYFLQSKVCLKLLAFDLLELLLLSAFPELDYIFKQLHEEKHRFGEFKES